MINALGNAVKKCEFKVVKNVSTFHEDQKEPQALTQILKKNLRVRAVLLKKSDPAHILILIRDLIFYS